MSKRLRADLLRLATAPTAALPSLFLPKSKPRDIMAQSATAFRVPVAGVTMRAMLTEHAIGLGTGRGCGGLDPPPRLLIRKAAEWGKELWLVKVDLEGVWGGAVPRRVDQACGPALPAGWAPLVTAATMRCSMGHSLKHCWIGWEGRQCWCNAVAGRRGSPCLCSMVLGDAMREVVASCHANAYGVRVPALPADPHGRAPHSRVGATHFLISTT